MPIETLNPVKELKRQLPFGEAERARLEKLEAKIAHDSPYSVIVGGHFSAGKSTLLNELLGAELLPASPIPTTANIMTVVSGAPGLTAFTNDGEERSFSGHIPWDELQSFALDGKGIHEIKLSLPLPFLPAGVTLADTPGVDSTDETHGKYTGAELLTTDAVIYVTDYNHVRSETNLRFLRQMQRENKPVVLVVNQIDKHDEEELPFSIFAHGLRDMLYRFGIEPAGLYFTSCHKLDHPYNELTNWISDMRSWLYHGETLRDHSEARMVHSAATALRERLYIDREQGEKALEETLHARGYSKADHQQLLQTRERLRRLDTEKWEAEENLRNRLHEFFKQTYLFPHELTELAKTWVESLKPSFKIGMFTSAKKKEKEQERRETALIEALKKRWETEVCLYLREQLKKQPLSATLNRQVQTAIQEMPFPAAEPGWLRSFITDGEKNNQYIYQLTSQWNHALLQSVKKTMEPLQADILADFEQQTERERAELAERVNHLSEIADIEADNESALYTLDEEIDRVNAYLETTGGDRRLEEMMADCMTHSPRLAGVEIDIEVSEREESMPTQPEMPPLPAQPVLEASDRIDRQALEETLRAYTDQPYAETRRQQLLAAIEKRKHDAYTLVMAGAFSSGKSTFINALIEAEIMPVSPHPLTASFTIVRAPEGRHRHGDVSIRLKSAAVLDAEIQAVAYECGYAFDLSRLKRAEGLSLMKTDTLKEKQHLEYLRALQTAVKKEQYSYGKTYDMTLEQWQTIAAKEDHACLIETSTVYFQSEMTGMGWSFVDTPGVQSVNERHTRMAMEKIAQADAFIYLTYYHHAFSYADQAFIRQVTNVREPEYMVINAADLAKDEREAAHVSNYVDTQVKQAGCKETQTMTLSSKRALSSDGDQGFSDLLYLLQNVTVPSLQVKTSRDIETRTEQLIAELTTATDSPPEQEKESVTQMDTLTVDDSDVEVWEAYAGRRMLLALDDAFTATVHVGAVNGKDKAERHKQLKDALTEFLYQCEEQWQKEMDAFTRHIRESLREQAGSESFHDMNPDVAFNLSLSSLEPLVKIKKLDAFKAEVFSLLDDHVQKRIAAAGNEMRKIKEERLELIRERKEARAVQPDIAVIKKEIEALKTADK
ncbi:dynamin family protein [Natribacillus halophilus]|uniref:Small GTP-binding protein domain-containing protein n=1 Tax=Natribacillus halophilus TaxID=549003 RepID=A0A1G8JAA1_9BACI|nr:dynamin family protein [Natribacillus halophilus]SDI28003.1 small GTP-binding protein domain-containing protein [Natribacillus halophilus]